MRFLVFSRSREAIPVDVLLPMVHMMQEWVDEHTASGKMQDSFSFAGLAGGGAILDVDSLEELDSIMAGFPFGQHSEVTLYALADLNVALADFATRMEDVVASTSAG